ncbi:hypothetical protein OBBRIDRAFT_709693, partial [Obba rivulosa]
MGKLNIAHHKSYHPYRRDNIERVRRDEEDARLKDAAEEGRMLLADSEARIELLRQRAGARAAGSARAERESVPAGRPSSLASGGHINLFEHLERQQHLPDVRSTRRPAPGPAPETDKGIPLAPSAKDLAPWYSGRKPAAGPSVDEDRQLRDLARKSVSDPLTSINHHLA